MGRPSPAKEWRSASAAAAAGKLECAREPVPPTGAQNACDRYMGLDAQESSGTLAVAGPEREAVEMAGRGDERPNVDRERAGGGGAAACVSGGGDGDKLDAFGLAQQLRIGAIGTRVYKKRGQLARLGHLARAYGCLVGDAARSCIRNFPRPTASRLGARRDERRGRAGGAATPRTSERVWRCPCRRRFGTGRGNAMAGRATATVRLTVGVGLSL
jgi:hypothetical protein